MGLPSLHLAAHLSIPAVNGAKLFGIVIQPINRCLKRLQTLGVVSIDGDAVGLTEEWGEHPERIDELRSVVRRYVVAV